MIDPSLWEALRKQIAPFSDPKVQEALRKQIAPFSDPKVQEALRKQIAPFSDPSMRAALLSQLGPISHTALGTTIRDGLSAFDDATFVAELQHEIAGDVEAATAIALLAEAEATAGVTATDTPVPDEAVIRAWVASLSDEDVLKYAVTTCDILTGLLLLLAVLTPVGGVVAVVAAAADVLVRAARPLLEALDRQRPEDVEQ